MTTEVINKKDISIGMNDWLKNEVTNNIWLRLLGEFLSAFFFIFIINLIIALGEDGVPFFRFFYEYNLGTGLWIGLMTMFAFVWSQNTTLSANFINLVLTRKRKEINNREFFCSTIFQFIGGISGALLVYMIAGVAINSTDKLHAMGGALPKLKGLVNNNVSPDQVSWLNPWQSINFVESASNKGFVYLYAVIQGFINATWIVVAFILNSLVDKKTTNRSQQLLIRYIILVVGISITTIFYANTTNWVRLLTPTLVNVIAGEENSLLVMNTTFVFIAVQSIGILIVFFELLSKEEGENIGEKNGI